MDRSASGVSGRPAPVLVRVVKALDAVSEWSGWLAGWLIVPLMATITYEVTARYVFRAPTAWAYDTAYMLYGSHFMLPAAYALLKGSHIRTDIFYERWSPRTKATVDAVAYLLFFFPGMVFILYSGAAEAWHSWLIGERSEASTWRPVMYPLKTVIPVTALLLLLQGVSEFLKRAHEVLRGRPL